jgi:hypothetical protein
MKAGIEWCAAFVISFLVFGLKVFQQSYPILPMKAGIEWCAAFVIPFFTFGLRVFFNSPTQFLPMKAGIEWCAAFVIFFTFVLRVFSTVLPSSYPWKSISTVPPIPHLWKQGLSDVLPFVIPFFTFLRVFFNSPTQSHYYESGIEWCAALCDFLLYVFLRVFFNSPTQFLPTMKAGIDVLLFVIPFLCLILRVFFNSPTQSYPPVKECSFNSPKS